MADIIHGFAIKAPASKVQEALTTLSGLSGWWTKDVVGVPSRGGKIEFRFCDPLGEVKGQLDMEVLEASASAVQWRCVSGSPDWINTTIEFRLSEESGKTKILFGHKGWREVNLHYAHCSMKWAAFLLSLKQLVETGIGRAFPNDIQIED